MGDVIDFAALIEPPTGDRVTLSMGGVTVDVSAEAPPSMLRALAELQFAERHGDTIASDDAMARLFASVVRMVGDDFADAVGQPLALIKGVLQALGLEGKAVPSSGSSTSSDPS